MSINHPIIKTKYIDFPFASVSGYFNGDMFEDWLNTTDKNDPYRELKRFFIVRDEQIRKQEQERLSNLLKESEGK